MDTSNTASRHPGLNKDEILFDNLYVDSKNTAGLPLELKVGRQDLLDYGEGFVIFDGTPEDGARTFYFDAVKVVLNPDGNYKVDLLWISDQLRDRALPSWYDEETGKRKLNTTDEQSAVAYGRLKCGTHLQLEPYYMYKREQATTVPFANENSALKLNTFGSRLVYTFGSGWKIRGEYAQQFGTYDSGDNRAGHGGYAYFGRTFEHVALKPSFDLSYVYLSGDNPSTTHRIEAWIRRFRGIRIPGFTANCCT